MSPSNRRAGGPAPYAPDPHGLRGLAWRTKHGLITGVSPPGSRYASEYQVHPSSKGHVLEILEDTCTVKTACAAVGISRNLAYEHRASDLQFRRDWDAAVERALDALLGTAYVRATEDKSDQVLITLLRFRYGDQMRERLSVQVEPGTGLTADALLQMAPEDRDALRSLLAKYAAAEAGGGDRG